MNKKLFSNILVAAIFLTLNVNLGNHTIFAQHKQENSLTQQVVQAGQYSFVDAERSGLSAKQVLQCGPASSNPVNFANGAFIKADLSFGLIPPSPDRLGSREQYIGSWAVRNIFPADGGRPESVSLIYFDGFLTSGSISNLKGGGRSYDVYGSANFTGRLCESVSNYDTRYYARFTGACGIDQDITFELSTRPPRNDGFGAYFREEDIYARSVFKGNVTCGTANDTRRVRSNLSTRR